MDERLIIKNFGPVVRAAAYTAIACLLLVFGCTSHKKIISSNSQAPAAQLSLGKVDNGADKIVFLTMAVELTDSAGDAYSFKQVGKTLADGALKGSNNKTLIPEPGYLYCEFANSSNQALDKLKIEDPLNTIYEYPGDSNGMGKATITKKSGELYLRFQYNSSAKYLSIYKFSTASKNLKKIYYAELVP